MDRFDYIRNLSGQLDMAVGVLKRKNILAGSEKLTYRYDPDMWSAWLSGVIDRLNRIQIMNLKLESRCRKSLNSLREIIEKSRGDN